MKRPKLDPCKSFKIEQVFRRKKPRRGFSKPHTDSNEVCNKEKG